MVEFIKRTLKIITPKCSSYLLTLLYLPLLQNVQRMLNSKFVCQGRWRKHACCVSLIDYKLFTILPAWKGGFFMRLVFERNKRDFTNLENYAILKILIIPFKSISFASLFLWWFAHEEETVISMYFRHFLCLLKIHRQKKVDKRAFLW